MKTDVTDSIEVAFTGEKVAPGSRDARGYTRTFNRRRWLVAPIAFAAAAIVYGVLVPARDHRTLPVLPPDGRSIAERLDDPDVQRRNAAFRAAIRQHDREVAALLALASKPKERYELSDSRELAVDVLAHYGTREPIPMYVRNIEYFSPDFPDGYSPLNYYPCALALRKIGLSAQPEIFTFLQTTPREEVSDKAVELYAHLMRSIYHANAGGHDEAVEVVRRATERASERQRENMQRLLEKLEQITKGWAAGPHPAHPTE